MSSEELDADDVSASPPDDVGEGDIEGAEEVSEVYSRLDIEMDEEEFRERVSAKVEQMGGLCDELTAAKLVSHELGEKEVYDVDEIEPEANDVRFVGKVTSIGERRTFERDDGDDGVVANIEVADETGRVRVALWDEYAESVDELETGQVLKVAGTPKQGKYGVEVSATQVETDDETDVEVVDDSTTIDGVQEGMSGVNLTAKVLETSSMNTFSRDDGTEGRVSNLIVGDGTGWIRLTLWDDRAPEVEDFSEGDVVEVTDGYAKERDGAVELHVGERGSVREADADVGFDPDTTPIAEVELDESYDISGVVTDTGEKRTFSRDDGTEGRVKNIRVRDETGELRVALWGEHSERDFVPGDKVVLTNVSVKEGWNDGVEGSANWDSTVTVVDSSTPADDEGEETESEGLDSFTD